ncbi:adenylate/guanylate cyclase domain-containing protein [Rhodovibrionaceae bacterium A322]
MERKLRLVSGLILMAYVVTHLINHSLGLISLSAMNVGLTVLGAPWSSVPGNVILYGSTFVHMALAIHALYRRRRFRMSQSEIWQLTMGFLIPPLLVLHVVSANLTGRIIGVDPDYDFVSVALFVLAPQEGIRQLIVTLVVWIHGCIGVRNWLRFKPWYEAWRFWLFAPALLLPTLALLGAINGGREAAILIQDPAWMAADPALSALSTRPRDALDMIYDVQRIFWWVFGLVLVAVLLVRPLRRWWEHRRGRVALTFSNGTRAVVAQGTTILDAMRMNNVPHAALCGGKGRCSTCRVRLGGQDSPLPDAGEAEAQVLARVGAAPNVRLACQTVPQMNFDVTPLLPPNVSPREVRPRPGHMQGVEKEIVILFADLRGFTKLSEKKLPYDVVFLLNRYFSAMGTAVEEAGGRVDKFIGDGVMALFGVDQPIDQGARQALAGAKAMFTHLDALNASLKEDLPEPLRIGVGLHLGSVIVGEMGYGDATSLTAIGDAVNTASRLEALTKEFGQPLLVSDEVLERAGIGHDELAKAGLSRDSVQIRGRQQALEVTAISAPAELDF